MPSPLPIMALTKGFLLLCVVVAGLRRVSSSTDPADVAALKSLSKNWKNAPPSWKSGDPCGNSGERWEGVLNCSNSRITVVKLFNMGLEGTLGSEIGSLSKLVALDLSYNGNLQGPLPSSIGLLSELRILRLIACKFSGAIPNELGNLEQLRILALNSNNFNGTVPASLGRLSHLEYLDLADNQLSGQLPTSISDGSGLDQLARAEHFHLNKNHFSGPIPINLFNSNLRLLHILLDDNNLTGQIPQSIGLVQTLKILRLDNNSLQGSVPSSISNLTNLCVLNLANNNLVGSMPNLTGIHSLSYLDLSNNSFDPSLAPNWLSGLVNLTTLIIESGGLHGEVPEDLLSFRYLQEVRLRNNSFNGTLNMSNSTSGVLKIVNFQDNNITSLTLSSSYNEKLVLAGNPVCGNVQLYHSAYCQVNQQDSQYISANNLTCPRPYTGLIISRAPYYGYIGDHLPLLKDRLREKLNAIPVNFSIENYAYDRNAYLQVELKFCTTSENPFTRNDILRWLDLNTQDLSLPESLGPSYFDPAQYNFKNKAIRGLIIGIAIGSIAAVLVIAGLTFYAYRQRKQALKAFYLRNPFAYWGSFGENAGDAPQLKGAISFSLDELRKFTDDFSKMNLIGSGGYGKVYKGILPDGRIVAIKRSEKGSMQGGLEFKTEIELLSRVHHRNLVELVGFCYEKGELLLVYEYISNGSLRQNLCGKKVVELDWKRRLMIALDSARGLAYLHDHANPSIIHRDVKSTNILLDDKLTARVADFGLSTLVLNIEEGLLSADVKGTPGYLDPEYLMTQQLTAKSDVYSLGVVMLELITATPPLAKNRYIVHEVRIAIDGTDKEYYGLKDLIDPALLKSGRLDGLHGFIDLALKCLHEYSEHRPKMSDIVKEIEIMVTTYELNEKTNIVSPFAVEFGKKRDAVESYYDEIDLSRQSSTAENFGSSSKCLISK